MAHISLDLVPTRSVGPFVFGAAAQPLIEKYGLVRIEHDPPVRGQDWETYQTPPDLPRTGVYVEHGCVDGVGCFEVVYYQEQNLIGLALDRIRALFGCEEEFEVQPDERQILEYYRLGLQVWIRDGVVDSIMCSDKT